MSYQVRNDFYRPPSSPSPIKHLFLLLVLILGADIAYSQRIIRLKCGENLYDDRTQVCCKGKVFKNSPRKCYCCGGTAIEKEIKCCGDTEPYDASKYKCCGKSLSWVYSRRCCIEGKWTFCCNGKPYDFRSHLCCSNTL